jgi:hypothetical protein
VDYSWNEFKSLPNNKDLTLESLWIRYNDMLYKYGMYNTNSRSGRKKQNNDTINSFVDDDYVEDYFE